MIKKILRKRALKTEERGRRRRERSTLSWRNSAKRGLEWATVDSERETIAIVGDDLSRG